MSVSPITSMVEPGSDPSWSALYVMVAEGGRVAKVGACERLANIDRRLGEVTAKLQRNTGDPTARMRIVVKVALEGLAMRTGDDYHPQWTDIRAEVESLESAVRLALARRLGRLHGWTDFIHLDRDVEMDEWPGLVRAAWTDVQALGSST